jgi:peptide/nickel transport system substrate-binding protein
MVGLATFQRCLGALLLAVALLPAEAATLRWAARGDTQSMDPFAANEGVTNNINLLVFDTLVERNRQQGVSPSLATGWTVVNPLTWRFTLRRNVTFHDGTPLTADDVVFSIERSQQPTSQVAVYTRRLGKAVRIDDHTIELRLQTPNPVLLEHLLNVMVMSRAWCVAHHVERVPEFNANEESYSSRNAMGSGPFMLARREAGVRTTFTRNPNWWGRFEGNVTEVIFTPIAGDATRTAALLAGDVNFIQEAPTQDLARLAKDPSVRLTTGPENRLIFLGFDQFRDQLLKSSVKGRNPFKDPRVREAFFWAIDVQALKTNIMRGQSVPTACFATSAVGCLLPELETHPPADLAKARQLMKDAGYADGFELTLDCPNDRYINDQPLCVALVGMLARINVKLSVDARPKNLFFPRVQAHDTSFYLYGWGGGTTAAEVSMVPLLHTEDVPGQKGGDNNGRVSDPELDRRIDAAITEMDNDKRSRLVREMLARINEQHYVLPLHRQMLTWLSRANVKPVIMPSNVVTVPWIQID